MWLQKPSCYRTDGMASPTIGHVANTNCRLSRTSSSFPVRCITAAKKKEKFKWRPVVQECAASDLGQL